MMKRYKGISLIVCLLFSAGIFAQKNFYKEAERKFATFEYFAAIQNYKDAYKKVPKKLKPECLWKIAECYRLTNDAKQAEVYYAKAIKAGCSEKTQALLYQADMLKQQEKYADAKNKYEEYAKEVPSSNKGKDGAKSCQDAQDWKDHPTRYKVENMVQINTPQYEFAPMYAERKKYTTLLFSSNRPGAMGDVDPTFGGTYTDIFSTKIDKNGKWSTPAPLPSPISTKVNEAACVLDEKGSDMYFTRCGVEKGKQLKCQVYKTTKRGQTWDDPKDQRLPFCVDSFNFGHPALSKDEKLMIFASDVNDTLNPGFGGLDLYYVIYDTKTKTWSSKPVNLGPDINTAEDEAFPFLHADGTLYFASKGHSGMGGFDIFKSAPNGDKKWAKPENMKYPINSAGDDFAIIFESDKERGYFTSNRALGKGLDDIYSFVLPPLLFMLEGYVTEVSSKNPIPGATVKLTGSDNSSYEIKTDAKGYYKYEAINANSRYINANTSYVVSASALDVKNPPEAPDGYLGNPKAKITTVNLKESTNFNQPFQLKRIIKIMRMPLILFNLNKDDLGHVSNPKDSLEFLVKVLAENPSITVELNAHTDYRNDAKYNQDLSRRRAKTCVDYLITEKGIDPNRITPQGYGESQPAVLDTDRVTPSGKIIPKGTKLTEQWINANFPEKKNKDDYEFVMQINRRVAFTILRKDYVASGTTQEGPKQAPEIKVTKSTSEGGEGDTGTEWDNEPETPQTPQGTGTTTTTPTPPKQ